VDFKDIIQIVQSGGNVALLLSVYFIYKTNERLARIEYALRMYLDPKPMPQDVAK
jgi:hypothetical protein